MPALTTPLRASVPEAEFAALVTVEVAERLALKAQDALAAGDIRAAQWLLDELTRSTTTRTCTAVKDQRLSDAISTQARRAMNLTMERLTRHLPEAGETRP